MAKYSKKVMGKEVGQASVYAEPHTMTGKKVTATELPLQESSVEYTNKMNMSVGNIITKRYPETKTSGIKTRGNGAATKGTMARGPMA